MSRSGLAKTSVRSGLACLVASGVVAEAGTGRSRVYSTIDHHPLRAALYGLFDAEDRRFDALQEAVRDAARECDARTLYVWLYGGVARGEDGPFSDLDLVELGDPAISEIVIAAIAFGDGPAVGSDQSQGPWSGGGSVEVGGRKPPYKGQRAAARFDSCREGRYSMQRQFQDDGGR